MLSSLAFATVEGLQIIFIHHHEKGATDSLCTAFGWLVVYTQSAKVLFTMWVTFHLFCFTVFYKNLYKLEVLYVVTSLVVPAVIACVPLVTRSYALNASGRCYIFTLNDTDHIAIIERFVLWDGPAIAILVTASAAAVIMVKSLACRLCLEYELNRGGGQFWTALKQLLPLIAFPILFFAFMMPVFILDIYLAKSTLLANTLLTLSVRVFIVLWSMSSGVTLIIHILVVRCLVKKKLYTRISARV